VTLAAEGAGLLAVAAWAPRLIPMSWAVAVSVVTDFLAYLPTFRHAWLRPDEEPWIPYAMFGVAAGLVLAVADFRVMTGVIYPTYLFAADAAMVIMILASPHYHDARPAAAGARAFGSAPPMRLSAESAQWRPVTGRDWRQPDLGPAMPQRGPGYGRPLRGQDHGRPVRGQDHGRPLQGQDHGRPLRVRGHGRPLRAVEPTSW
jgi:hypothetical protein